MDLLLYYFPISEGIFYMDKELTLKSLI